jgi:hypothetical protein
MTYARIALILAAAFAAGFAGTNLTVAQRDGGDSHHHAHHADGAGGSWHMRDHELRHCQRNATNEVHCTPWQ